MNDLLVRRKEYEIIKGSFLATAYLVGLYPSIQHTKGILALKHSGTDPGFCQGGWLAGLGVF